MHRRRNIPPHSWRLGERAWRALPLIIYACGFARARTPDPSIGQSSSECRGIGAGSWPQYRRQQAYARKVGHVVSIEGPTAARYRPRRMG